MPQHKKDGKYINLRIDKQICEEFEAYAEEKGQTKTVALERILRTFLDAYYKHLDSNDIDLSKT